MRPPALRRATRKKTSMSPVMSKDEQDRAIRVRNLKESASYRQAHLDPDFMTSDELRPVRLQLEMMKPETIQSAYGINSTIVAFGGTRIVEKGEAEARVRLAESAVAANPDDEDHHRELRIAGNVLKKSHYYDEARELGRIVSSTCQLDENCDYVIVTGGGPARTTPARRASASTSRSHTSRNRTRTSARSSASSSSTSRSGRCTS